MAKNKSFFTDETGKKVLIALSALVILLAVNYAVNRGGNASVENQSNLPSGLAAETQPSSGETVKLGDKVEVNYVGSFENNTVFDTSYEDVAKSAGIYSSLREYQPLVFVVGAGELISGFEEAVVGMRVGEKKTVTLRPEKAYGVYNPERVMVMNRTYSTDRLAGVSPLVFENVLNVTPEVNKTFSSDSIPWPIFVLNVTKDSVGIRYDPVVGLVFETMLGNATVVNLTEDSIWVRENPVVGSKILTRIGPAVITGVNESHVTLDFNHELANKTLVFQIQVESILTSASTD